MGLKQAVELFVPRGRIVGSLLTLDQKPVTALFMINENSGCFATSNQPASTLIVEAVGAYQLGVRAML